MQLQPCVLINAVGLTRRLLEFAPRLGRLAESGWVRSLREVVPAVTCTAQASILTGKLPQEHGIVGNGWLFRDTGEVRFWQQSNALIQAEPVYVTARRRALEQRPAIPHGQALLVVQPGGGRRAQRDAQAVLWRRRQQGLRHRRHSRGAVRAARARPGPISRSTPSGDRCAGLPCTQWIARSAAEIIKNERPELTLVYLPHLDYDPQRFGPSGCDMARLVARAGRRVRPVLEQARAGRRTGVGRQRVRSWRRAAVRSCSTACCGRLGCSRVRPGPFGEMLDTFGSQAFAVCDHQVAHVYLNQAGEQQHQRARRLISGLPGVACVLTGARPRRDRPRPSPRG